MTARHAAARRDAGVRLTRRSRAGCGLALTGHVAAAMPWGPLAAGCLAGVAVSVSLLAFAGPVETPADLVIGVRAGFLPVCAGLAFVFADPHRVLAGALPAASWRTAALRLALAVPVLTATGAIELALAGRALAVDAGAGSHRAAALIWPGLAAELIAWCLLAVLLAAGLDRTRWRDVSGVTAAVSAMATVGVAGLLPLHLLPADITGMTGAEHRQWVVACCTWAGVGAAALAGAGWATGDPWQRIRLLPGLRRA